MERVPLRFVMAEGLVQSGFSFRERIANDPAGDVAVIQMKDLRAGHSAIEQGGFSMVRGEDISSRHHLERGDVLFVAKGANNRAVVYDVDLRPAVAASAFFVLRPDRNKIDPHFLAWWINQEPTQQFLHQNMAGTYIPNITRPVVESITVPLPSLEQQRLIARVAELSQAEQRINDQLRTKRRQLVDQILLSSINQHANSSNQ